MQTQKACNIKDLKPTGVICPICQMGELIPARGRWGAIYKCNNELKCRFFLNSRPIGQRCTYKRDGRRCGRLMVEGTKTIPDRCSDRECPNRHPHKLAVKP